MAAIFPSIQMGVTAGIFLASILLKEMRYLVYITYICQLSAGPPRGGGGGGGRWGKFPRAPTFTGPQLEIY